MLKFGGKVPTCLVVIAIGMSSAAAAAATATAPRKTPAQCNQEFYSRISELRSAGELPSRFIHDCWSGTLTGADTPIIRGEPAASRVEPSPAILVRKASEAAPHSSWRGTGIARERFGVHGLTRYVMQRPAHHRVASFVRRPRHQGYVEIAARQSGNPTKPLFSTADPTLIQAAPELVYGVAALAPQTDRGRQWARSLLAGAAQKRSSEVAAALIDLSVGSSGASDMGTRRWIRGVVCDQPVIPSSDFVSPICLR